MRARCQNICFFNDGRWPGFDDGVYAGARILEILSREADLSAVLEALPGAVNTPELQIRMAEDENKAFIVRLQKEARFDDALDVITIDGVRVEWNDGFALARSSNTTPVVVLRLEGDMPEALERIKPEFADLFYAYGVLDSGRFIGESSYLVGLGSNQASFYLRA